MFLIDSHAHLNDDAYENLDEIISNYRSENVKYILMPAYNMESSRRVKALSEKIADTFYAVGVHPQDADKIDFEELKSLANSPKCVAIGEIGLDYHYEDGLDRNTQKTAFINQINLANDLSLPVIIHSRDAGDDTLEVLKANKLKCGGVMHCFSGSAEMAEEFLKLGLYISFSGSITFKNARKLLDAVKVVPLAKILSETDSPYLSPYRSQRNEPRNVKLVVEKIAELKEIDVEELEGEIFENFKTLFSLKCLSAL